MPWIADVAPYTTILSSWGNNIRNRVVHPAADANDYNAIVASAPVGSLVHKVWEGSLWRKTTNGTMVEMIGCPRTFTPRRWEGSLEITNVTAMDYCEYQRDNGWVTYTGAFHWTMGVVTTPQPIYVDLPLPAAVPSGQTVGSLMAYDATLNRNYGGVGFVAFNGGLGGYQPGAGQVGTAGSGVFDEQHGIADGVNWTVRYKTNVLT